MSVHARAPVRIDFAGGWTDVATFAQEAGGVVTNAALTLYAHADFFLGGNRIRLCAEDLHQHVSLSSPTQLVYDGQLDLHKAALNMLPVTGGIEILTRSDAPAGSGLGASGALDVALVAGLLHCRRESYDREELAELGYQLETVELGLLGGRQDQYAAALGGFHQLVFEGNAVECRRLSVDEEKARVLQQHLVLVYTGQSHFSSQTHERVWEAWSRNDSSVCEALIAIRDLGNDAGAAIGDSDWRRLADVIEENWRQQQRLDATISTPQVERIEHAARDAGAWGVKATGAGAGGCLLIVCPPNCREAVADSTVSAGGAVLEFSFDFDGVAVWETEDAPTDG